MRSALSIQARDWWVAMLIGALLICGACRSRQDGQAVDQQRPTISTQQPALSVKTKIGFASRQKFEDHYEKHGREFGSVSEEEYLRLAQELRDHPANSDVLESVRADRVVTRYDRRSGAFLAFNQDLTIRTFFKPNDGENYFRRQSKR